MIEWLFYELYGGNMEAKEYKVSDIVDHIISNYPESCLAYNIGDNKNNIEYKEYLYDDCLEFFYNEKLNWCSCGQPEVAQLEIRKYLQILYDDYIDDSTDFDPYYKRCRARFRAVYGDDVDSIYRNPLLLCLAYALDGAEFTEHGGGIGSAWLTDEGFMFLKILNTIGLEEGK